MPLPSFTTLAVTPAFALLIASRIPSSVLVLSPMVICAGSRSASASKLAPVYCPVAGFSVPPSMVPKLIVMVPLPIAVFALACPVDTSDCDCASCVTSMA